MLKGRVLLWHLDIKRGQKQDWPEKKIKLTQEAKKQNHGNTPANNTNKGSPQKEGKGS